MATPDLNLLDAYSEAVRKHIPDYAAAVDHLIERKRVLVGAPPKGRRGRIFRNRPADAG